MSTPAQARRKQYVYCNFREYGLLGIETEAEKMLVLAALNLVECIAETAPKSGVSVRRDCGAHIGRRSRANRTRPSPLVSRATKERWSPGRLGAGQAGSACPSEVPRDTTSWPELCRNPHSPPRSPCPAVRPLRHA